MSFHFLSAEGRRTARRRRSQTAAWGLLMSIVAVFALSSPSWAMAADPVVAAVGDMVCDPLNPAYANGQNGIGTRCRHKAVANAIAADGGVSAFLPLGDVQYECGGRAAFNTAYNSTYGQPALIGKTFPIPGNHEYHSAAQYSSATGCSAGKDGSGYMGYFGAARSAGKMPRLPADAVNPAKGFYTYNLGAWHVIAINTNDMCNSGPGGTKITCRGPKAATKFKGSPQERWLRADLAANANRCVLAYMHYPRWSSNLASSYTRTADPNDSAVSGLVASLWNDLYVGGAEVVLSGHTHNYERFHPMNAGGGRDDTFGVRQFDVGTGGVNLELNKRNIANSAARMGTRKFGYLRLTLSNGSFSWVFKAIDGSTADPGSANCHGAPPAITSPRAGGVIAGGRTTLSAKVTAPAATSSVDFYAGSTKLGTAGRSAARCHTSIATDPAVFYTSPFCIYSVTVSTRSLRSGPYNLRAVTRSSDPSTPGATATSGGVPITFQSGLTGIASITTGTRNIRQIATPTTKSLRDAAYSRARTRIAYTSGSGIVVANADGSGARVLPGTAGASQPDWALKDTVIVYLKPGSISTTPASGGASKRIATGRILGLAVGPGGGRVIYQVRMPNGRSDIFGMSATGAGKRNLTRTRLVSEMQPTWRNAKVIAFTRLTPRWAVFRMPAKGGKQVRITNPLLNCQQPAFSPNGARLACVTRLSSTRSIVRTLTAKGLGLRNLLIPVIAGPTQPAWANDRVVAYTTR